MKENTRNLKFSIPASALSGLVIVVINRLLNIPLSPEEYALVSIGLTVIFNTIIDLSYRKLGVA